jgi:hypothetical protein
MLQTECDLPIFSIPKQKYIGNMIIADSFQPPFSIWFHRGSRGYLGQKSYFLWGQISNLFPENN